jgi:hypothetical protein
MIEESNAPSQTPIPKFVLGNKVRPLVYLRHKRNISSAVATFEHANRVQLERMDFTNVGPFTTITERLQPVESSGASRTSRLEFKAIKIERWMQPGLYVCASLEVHYLNDTRGIIAVPYELQFEMVEHTPETPEVQRVEWGDPLA